MTFSLFSQPYFKDWQTENYESVMTSFFHVMEDDMFWMQTPYIEVFMHNEDDGIKDPNYREVGCIVQARWDWSEVS